MEALRRYRATSPASWRRRLAAAAALAGALAAQAQTYQAIDLATFAQGTSVTVRGPNGLGVGAAGGKIAGVADGSAQRRGFLLRGGGAQPVAGLPGNDNTAVLGVNDTGTYVGSSNTATALRAIAGTAGGAVRELPPLPGDVASLAAAVNNAGEAVGFSSGAAGQRAVRWDAGGTPALLPGANALSQANAINQRGDVAGTMAAGTRPRPVLWPAGAAAMQLPLLAGHASGEATGINARGDAVGYSAGDGAQRRAVLWPWSGGVTDLGTLPGGSFSYALGSNAAGAVVGASTSGNGGGDGEHAFLWTPAAGLQDLNALIAPAPFVLRAAMGINDAGSILAIGQDRHVHAAGSPGDDHEAHEAPVRVFLLVRTGAAP